MKTIFLAGHRGMVGSAICRLLQKQSDIKIITRTREELDLCDQRAVFDFMRTEKPDEVILAAAKVGGIYANNTYPAEFIYNNLQIQNNVIHAAHKNDVQKLLFLGSSCIYPRVVEQPMKEEALMTGPLEPTNEPYAIAKIAGIKMCESYNRQYGRDYRSIMPTNLYGPRDNYHPENSHVVPALISRFHEAKKRELSEVVVWGSGMPMREFLHVYDMADASIFIHNLSKDEFSKYTQEMRSHINVGSGKELMIKELAMMIKEIVGFNGKIIFDISKPDGAIKKQLHSEILNKLGWYPSIDLYRGLQQTYRAYLRELESVIS